MRRALGAVTAVVLATTLMTTAGPMASANTRTEALLAVDGLKNGAEKLDADVRWALDEAAPDTDVSVIVRLRDQVDLTQVVSTARDADLDDEATQELLIESLTEEADAGQASVRSLLAELTLAGEITEYEPYWIFNGFAVTATPEAIATLAGHPEVDSIEVDHTFTTAGLVDVSGPAEWNLDQIGAPDVWAAGSTGENVVVAVLDTGADINGIASIFPSPIASTWRGGTNSWFDPYSSSTAPYDLTGHGTSVISVIAADRVAGGPSMSVAPGAQWIGAKIYDDSGVASASAVHQAFQWVLDPDGDPSTDDGADIVNGSWSSASPSCSNEFQADLQALRAAGVLPVFSAGNLGPNASSVPSPAGLPEAFSVGANDAADVIATTSSRGPSLCGGTSATFPDVVAPGVAIRAATVQGQVVSVDGTSFSAPHVTGAAALLLSQHPDLGVDELADLLRSTAVDLGASGPDDVYGAGRLDVSTAHAALDAGGSDPTDAAIGGIVWLDADDDGTVDAGESGAVGVTVRLTGAGPDTLLGTADDIDVADHVIGANGTYSTAALAAGSYRVEVVDSSLPIGATVPGGMQRDIDLAVSQVLDDIDFAVVPAPNGEIAGSALVDIDGDGLGDHAGDPTIVVRLTAAGADDTVGTADDVLVAQASLGAGGAFVFADVVAGHYGVAIATESLPAGASAAAPTTIDLQLAVGETRQVDPLVYSLPPSSAPVIHFSTNRSGTTASGLAYDRQDILSFDGTTVTMFFDGSDVGLGRSDVDAVDVLDDGSLLLSFSRKTMLPGGVKVVGADIVRFVPTTLGETTAGTFEMYLRGTDVGLDNRRLGIDALDLLPDGRLVVSVNRTTTLFGVGEVTDKDLLALTFGEGSDPSEATWSWVFDGSTAGLDRAGEDIDAVAVAGDDLVLSTRGRLRVDGFRAGQGTVIRCLGYQSQCALEIEWAADILGTQQSGIDAISVDGG